jgi:hypothetical protein
MPASDFAQGARNEFARNLPHEPLQRTKKAPKMGRKRAPEKRGFDDPKEHSATSVSPLLCLHFLVTYQAWSILLLTMSEVHVLEVEQTLQEHHP